MRFGSGKKTPTKNMKPDSVTQSRNVLYLNPIVRRICIFHSQFMIKQDLKQLVPAIRTQFACNTIDRTVNVFLATTRQRRWHTINTTKGWPETRAWKRSACKTYTMKCFPLTSRAWPILFGRTPINLIHSVFACPCERSVKCAIKRLATHKSILAN